MTRTTKKRSNSNAAAGTKQVWVQNCLHWAMSEKAKVDERTIKVTVERALLESLGFGSMDDVRAAYEKAHAK